LSKRGWWFKIYSGILPPKGDKVILNSLETRIISSLGWVEKSGLLIIDIPSKKTKIVKLGGADYISLKKISGEYFIAINHFKSKQLTISIHSFDDPEVKLDEVTIIPKDSSFEGKSELWKITPRYYVEYFVDGFNNGYKLINIDIDNKKIELSRLEWFDDSYDYGYQGVIDVIQMPDSGNLLFSVQRDSYPVLYNFFEKKVVRKISLAGRAGNPIFAFRNDNKEIWCVDYDTLLRIDCSNWKILSKARLQLPSLALTQRFIGNFSFSKDEKYCVVARPFNKDVILLKSSNLKLISRFKVKEEPLDVIILSNFEFIYRDWKTGDVGYGVFKVSKV